ncbi:ABC transporter ATP-binding protein [Streptomyces sp. AV19]|nr:ABC transporter ATP-binding protein [Streptomyces sp. AV19]
MQLIEACLRIEYDSYDRPNFRTDFEGAERGSDHVDMDADSAWEHVALVPQEWARWPFHARENVTLGRVLPEGDKAVWNAARRSGAQEVIESLPKGLDQLLGKELWSGHGLSGGQRQRIAIARAFYRPAGLFVLDEPTSALDARAEHHIFRELREQASDRCTVLVTHRIENTRFADRIVVMNKGRIEQMGTYDELVAVPGLFSELHALSQDR